MPRVIGENARQVRQAVHQPFGALEAGTPHALMVGVVVQPARPERREFTRIRLLTPFHGRVVGVHAPMLLKDISLGGFSVVSSIPFPVGTEHPFEFSLMEHEIVLSARVAHCTRTNTEGKPVHVVGFAFVRNQASDGDTIEALVQAVLSSSLAVAHR